MLRHLGILFFLASPLAAFPQDVAPPKPSAAPQPELAPAPVPAGPVLSPEELERRLLPLSEVLRPARYRVEVRSLRVPLALLAVLDPPCSERLRRAFDAGSIDHALLGDLERLLASTPNDAERIRAEQGQHHRAEFWIESTGTSTRERELPLGAGKGVSLLIVPGAKFTYGHEARELRIFEATEKLQARSPELLFHGLPVTAIDRAAASQGTWTESEVRDPGVDGPILRLRGAPRGEESALGVLLDVDPRTGLPLAQAKVDAQGKLTSLALYRFQEGAGGTPRAVPRSATMVGVRADKLTLDDHRVLEHSDFDAGATLQLEIDADVMLIDRRAKRDTTLGRDPAKWPPEVLAHVRLPGQVDVGPSLPGPVAEPAAVAPTVLETSPAIVEAPPPAPAPAPQRDGRRTAWIAALACAVALAVGAFVLRRRKA